MHCPGCDHENAATARFCEGCGKPLERACPRCGVPASATARFCSDCGAALEPATQRTDAGPVLDAREGERRQATIVFSDLSGYTAMSETLDPEEVEQVMSRVKAAAVRIVEGQGGIVNQFVGDEVVAVFGIPTAHEDDAVRAVGAALDLHHAVRGLSAEVEHRIGTVLRMHTGINSGLMVTHLRDDRDGRYSLTGDAVNTGARLAAQADADTILLSPETQHMVAPYFRCEALAPLQLKGKAHPIVPYRVLARTEVRSRLEAAEPRGLTPYVGRDAELATLNDRLQQAIGGAGQVVTVAGEAGLGKSRLRLEFRRGLDRTRFFVLEGRCRAQGSEVPYLPFIDSLWWQFRLTESDSSGQTSAKLVSGLRGLDAALEPHLPVLLDLMSVPSPEHPMSERLQAEDMRHALTDAFRELITVMARRRPTVFVLEDWHWADPASDELLRSLIPLIADLPVLLLVLYRPEYRPSWPPMAHHTALVLQSLAADSTAAIVQATLQAREVPDGLVALIRERTGGNPFFTEEVCSALLEEGTVRVEHGRAVLTRGLEAVTLPGTVHAVIRSRIDRLTREAQEALKYASVIGQEFSRLVLDEIVHNPSQATQALDTLKGQDLIQQIRLIPDAAFRFKHALTQVVVYDTLLLQSRKELHGLVFHIIERVFAERLEEYTEALLYHARQGELWEEVARYCAKVTAKGAKRGAFREMAVAQDQRILALSRLPATHEHRRLAVDSHMIAASSHQILGNPDEALRYGLEAVRLADELGDRERQARAAAALSVTYHLKGQYRKGIELHDTAPDFSQSPRVSYAHLWRPHGAGLNWAGLGQYRRALEQISEFMAAAGRPEALAADAGLMFSQGVSAMALCRAALGEFAQGFATLEESLPVVNRYGTTFVQSQLLAARAMLELGQGAFQPAAEALEKSLALARKVNIPLLSFFVGGLLGEARLALGRWSDALPLLEAATSPEGLSLWPLNGRFLAGHAEALLAAGQPEAALKRARSALEGAAHREARAEQAALLRVLCEIALSGHAVPGGDAAHWITAALALARELDLRPLAAHCRMSLSRAHGAAGRQGPARRERQTALAEYEALGIRPGPGHPAQGVSSDKPRPALA